MLFSTARTSVCAAAAVLIALPAVAQTRGYTARPSGYDLNFNGTPGQGGTADVNLCDGQGDQSSTTGEDLDGNGVNDRQVYVDLSGGSDNASCGLPGSPCLTITFAMNGSNSSVAGGPIQTPAVGQIQAVCFKGVGRETVVPAQSGASGTYVLPRTGSQVRSFNLPRYPFVLSGWDANNNDQYPPYDAGDTAVLDGTFGGSLLDRAIDNSVHHVSNIEYAHFTARNYGRTSDTADRPEGFMKVVGNGGSASQIYVHDVQLTAIMKGEAHFGFHIGFNLFLDGTLLSDFAIVNINVTEMGGGYFVRGSGAGTAVVGPYRFQNISLTAFGKTDPDSTCSTCYWAGFKLWDYVTGVEILDNNFDANPSAWGPHSTGGAGTFGIGVSYCSQDWTIRGNSFTDFKQFVNVSPYYGTPGTCESRPIDRVVIDRNFFRNTYQPWQFGDFGIFVEDGNSTVDTVGTVTVTNNFLSSTTGWEACMWLQPGNPGGPDISNITVAGNTCHGPINRHAAIVIGNPEGAQAPFPGQRYTIRNNVISGAQGGLNMKLLTIVSSLSSNGNAFDPQSGFSWNGSSLSLAGWRSSSGGDLNSKQCTPSYGNELSGNFRLSPGDACARASGVPMASITSYDIDAWPRSTTTPSIGGSEGGSGVAAPPAPANLKIIR